MKKVFSILSLSLTMLMVLYLGFSSCKKDDEGGDKFSLYGKWKIVSLYLTDHAETSLSGKKGDIIEFKSDKNAIINGKTWHYEWWDDDLLVDGDPSPNKIVVTNNDKIRIIHQYLPVEGDEYIDLERVK